MEFDQHPCLRECNCAATADSSLCLIQHINVVRQIVCGYTIWEQQLGKSYVVQQGQHMSL